MNTLHFAEQDQQTADVDEIMDAVESFYMDGAASGPFQGTAISSWYHQESVTGDFELKVYNLNHSKPRAPVATRQWDFTPTTAGQALPQQVSIVLSWQASEQSGINQNRRRNRIYFGPTRSGALKGDGLVANTTKVDLVHALGRLREASVGAATWRWVVYSPSTQGGGSPIDGALSVDNAWVDDRFDIQRRRAINSTTREQIFF